MEPSSGADPDLAPYEGAVTAVYDGVMPVQLGSWRMSWGTRARTWTLLGQNQMCCLSYTIPHSATAVATRKGFRLRVAVRTEEPKILGSVIRGVAVDVIHLED